MISFTLKITIGVIRRRVENGETLDAVILSYPKLTTEEIETIRKELLA